MITVTVAKDFSRHPAGRFLADGPYSGQLFRQKFLESNIRTEDKIIIIFDGARGYGSSFLEEAFGGLIRAGIPKELALSKLDLQTSNPDLRQEVLEYIEEAIAGTYAAR